MAIIAVSSYFDNRKARQIWFKKKMDAENARLKSIEWEVLKTMSKKSEEAAKAMVGQGTTPTSNYYIQTSR